MNSFLILFLWLCHWWIWCKSEVANGPNWEHHKNYIFVFAVVSGFLFLNKSIYYKAKYAKKEQSTSGFEFNL